MCFMYPTWNTSCSTVPRDQLSMMVLAKKRKHKMFCHNCDERHKGDDEPHAIKMSQLLFDVARFFSTFFKAWLVMSDLSLIRCEYKA